MPHAKSSVLCEQLTAYGRTSREQVSCHKHKHIHVAVSEAVNSMRCNIVLEWSENPVINCSTHEFSWKMGFIFL